MSDWDLLGGNPAPGEPGLIRQLATEVSRTATSAHEARLVLDGIGSELATANWTGKAAAGFRQEFAGIAPDLGAMAESYLSVSTALTTYASRLEGLQPAVNDALTRAKLAKQREQLAGPQRDAAVKRVADLTRQLNVVRGVEMQKTMLARTPTVDPALDAQHQQALTHVQATRRTVEGSLRIAVADQAAQQRDIDAAQNDYRQARATGSRLRGDREHAEQEAAITIHGALDSGLRNRSFWDRGGDWLGQQLTNAADNIGDLATAVRTRDWDRIVAEVHKAIEALEPIVGLISTVVSIAAFFIPVLAPIAFALAALTLVLAVTKLLTSTYLAVTKYHDPETGRQMADYGDVGWAAFGVGLSVIHVNAAYGAITQQPMQSIFAAPDRVQWLKLRVLNDGESSLTNFKRAIFRDARTATGFWRDVPVASPGHAASSVERGFHGVVGIAKVVDKGLDAKKEIDAMAGFVQREIFGIHRGAAVPVVGPCYAN